ncbi:fructose-bisphosphate aldolase-lysine N-methyltransferase, chloroplastic-like [Ananas comosus]|uniref:Fructose-bisphosphate aldolase-lysine N-methyltransferase, chloroplastic-like n=1 Tax=Ananas comosus TaxID=4615 RepID=A0A6P5F7B7_ANACO|nr:fructose-bisphosphate aldolase-lysine N-methyltransferase, chloroplastic-like [Ananas comosus]
MDEMHNTIFWSDDDLQMISQSPVYKETFEHKANIEKEFLALKPALECFPQIFGDLRLENFMHACALVSSRAWKTSKGVSLISFADFLNHDGTSDSVLLSDDYKEISEVLADRDYGVGELVMIRYGKFSNATLLLDFGFTVPNNIYDQVILWFPGKSMCSLILCSSLLRFLMVILHYSLEEEWQEISLMVGFMFYDPHIPG